VSQILCVGSFDYKKLSEEIVFAAGSPPGTTLITSIEILDDSEVEPCEEFTVVLYSEQEEIILRENIQINDNEGKNHLYNIIRRAIFAYCTSYTWFLPLYRYR